MARRANQREKEAHILLIVYEHFIRDLLARMLTERGHEVVTCSAGPAGIRMFGKSKKRFDVVMSDIVLPDISGFGVAKQIKEMSHETPIILMKGPDKELDLTQFKESGADLVISRPFSMHNTVHLVEGLIEMETG
jgi:DNA-binding response OmpR family regulator